MKARIVIAIKLSHGETWAEVFTREVQPAENLIMRKGRLGPIIPKYKRAAYARRETASGAPRLVYQSRNSSLNLEGFC